MNCKLQTAPAHQNGLNAADFGPQWQVVQEARPPRTMRCVFFDIFEQAMVASPHQPLRLDPLPLRSSSSQVPKIAHYFTHTFKRSPHI